MRYELWVNGVLWGVYSTLAEYREAVASLYLR